MSPRSGRGVMPCGYCRTRLDIEAGLIRSSETVEGLARKCRCDASKVEAATVDELRRDGKRTLRPPQYVTVQPKQRLGTKRHDGELIRIEVDPSGSHVCLVRIVADKTSTVVRVAPEWIEVPNRT